MLASLLEKKIKKLDIHYGWVIMVITFLTSVFSSAAISAPQVLMLPIIKALNWNISDISSAIAIMLLVLACLAPFGGALMLKLGISKVVIISCILSVLGLLITVFVSQKWHLFIGIGIFLGISSGILGLGLSATVATRWFNKKRGLVVGILTSGFAAGQLIFVPFMAWITTQFDWRMAILPVLIGSIFCSILFFLFGKNWPSEINIPPYGEKKLFVPPQKSENSAFIISFINLNNAIKHPAFWILSLTFFICGFTSTGLVSQHFIPFCADNNIGIVVASSYLAIMGIFNFLGTMGSGWLSDRYDNYLLLAGYYSFRGISLIYLPYSNLDVTALTLWAVFFGLDYIATVPPTVRLTSKFFGTVNGPIIFGWIFAFHQFGASFAAFSAGVGRDTLLTYGPVFFISGITCFIATILILLFKINYKFLVQNKV